MKHSGFAGHIGVAREDITPPPGIFFRNWGAAKHDAATGIHRPLTLTALTLQQEPHGKPLVLIETDLGWWTSLPFEQDFRSRLLEELKLDPTRLIFGLSHTHAAPPLCNPEPGWKGGELLPAHAARVFTAAVHAAKKALATAQPATLEWHTGKCNLATHRDLRDGKRFVCGYHPEGHPDDTLLLGRVTDAAGKILATVVNYACHPTTLSWDNVLVSPDFVGAMRETIQQNTGGAPALFLQGAAGDLGPRYGMVGDPAVPDMHGRQLGFAALATLADMEPPATELVFSHVVESGAPIAVWQRRPRPVSRELRAVKQTVDLQLKDWPSTAELRRQFEACPDRSLAERIRRKLRIREALGDGATFPLEVWGWQIGEAVLGGALVEAYSPHQRELRQSLPDRAVIWMNLINGSLGYVPPAPLYDEDLYQVWQTPFERGGAEKLTAATIQLLRSLR